MRGWDTGGSNTNRKMARNPANDPCGLRLLRLLDERLPDIVRREQGGESRLRLYGIGDYWVAFEQSAYGLCRLFPASGISVVTHASYPFPVVMAQIPDGMLRTYARSHILRRDEVDYKELAAPGITYLQYRNWHRQEVRELL